MKSRSQELLDKSVAAMLATVEIYNKPDFKYREEVFAVLAVNGWELLLKARILHLSKNRLSALCVFEPKRNKHGKTLTRKVIKTNRAGNAMTIGLDAAIVKVEEASKAALPAALKDSISAITELRDNAIHFYNKGLTFSKKLQEVGSAALKNYVILIGEWFGISLAKYNFYLMPLSFISDTKVIEGVVLNTEEQNYVKFVEGLEKAAATGSDKYDVTINVSISFIKGKGTGALQVEVVKPGSGATQVELSEEQVRKNYPWDYDDLTDRLRERYSDFKSDKKCHDLRKPLVTDPKYANRRFLDPGNPKSGKKDFYNPNIITFFDAHYTRKA